MVFRADADQPRFKGATPLVLLSRSAAADGLIRELDGGRARLEPVGTDTYSVRVDVPRGEWILWPHERSALWIGGNIDALPRIARELLAQSSSAMLKEAINRLSDFGVWVREAAILADGTWTRPRRAGDALATLTTESASAISGVFDDRVGRTARLEISAGGVCWTDRPTLAIEWLVGVFDLSMPT